MRKTLRFLLMPVLGSTPKNQKIRASRFCLTMESSCWRLEFCHLTHPLCLTSLLGLALCISCWGSPSSVTTALANAVLCMCSFRPPHCCMSLTASSSNFGFLEAALCRVPSFPLSWLELPFLCKHQAGDL